MEDNIQIKNPQEVQTCISREAGILNQYAELMDQEAKELTALESLISETEQTVNCKKRGLYEEIEQTRRQEDSEEKQSTLRECQKEIEYYEKQTHMVNQCREELQTIFQEYLSFIKDSMRNADNGKVLSDKMQRLIDKVIEVM